MSIKVYVNRKDCKEGLRCSGMACPFARALERKFKLKAIVGHKDCGLYNLSSRKTVRNFKYSKKLVKAILAYDKGYKFEPGHYSIYEYKP